MQRRVLEPSAGVGDLALEIAATLQAPVDVCEINPTLQPYLLRTPDIRFVGADFLQLPSRPIYDRVIANPPFDKQMTHIPRMYQHLKPGGRMVTLVNACYRHKKTNDLYFKFRRWLASVGAKPYKLPPGSFLKSDRPTGVNVAILVIDKPATRLNSRRAEIVKGEKMNLVNLAGRVGADPEVRYFESGKVKANLSLAVRHSRETTDWFNLEAWEKTAEIAAQYVRKGSLIGITGYLKVETWRDKMHNCLRTKAIIKVESIHLLSSNNKQEMEDEFN